MAHWRYPTLAEVIAIHEKVMRGLGEAARPLRAEGLLESALTRPQLAAYYEGADIVRQATLLGRGISQAHGLPDAGCFSVGHWLGVCG
jgi:prophage maintenance system killer protein